MVRIQPGVPFYSLKKVQGLVAEKRFQFGNRSAARDATTLDLDIEAIRKFILCLQPIHFVKRYPQQKCFNGRAVVDCDAYKMSFDVESLSENTRTGDLIFTKLGIHQLRSGEIVAVISLHLDR